MEAANSMHTITFGRQRIDFTVNFSRRKRLTIAVHPDLSVTVDAPDDRHIEEVINRVKRRAEWIVRQLDFFARFKPEQPPRRYVAGETHIYLGRQYRLKLIESDVEDVKLVRGYFIVSTRRPRDQMRVKRLLEEWYYMHSRTVILSRLERCYDNLRKFDILYPTSIKFRRMAKRWGSCGRNGNLVFNPDLARASIYCIDYVITHELCHLKYPNHGRDFYRLLEISLPDWERRKTRLESTAR